MIKILFKAFSLCTVFLFTSQVMSQDNSELIGKWRGVLKIQKNFSLAVGLNFKKHENDLLITLDSPNQGNFDIPVTDYTLSENQLSFKVAALQASYKGKIEGNKLIGTFTQGISMSLTFDKLDEQDKLLLQYEGGYGGNSLIHNTNKLPLVLQIAVVKGGYFATLDSPAQQSFGIPVVDIAIDSKQMSFKSPLIKAFYKGSFNNEGYDGTFTQGFENPLILIKNFDPTSDNSANVTPDFGNKGGAMALIENGVVTNRFFNTHSKLTQYEIGSITKTMTAFLLANQFQKKELTRSSMLTEFEASAPRNITIMELATHKSGLPRLPNDLWENALEADPYAHYDLKQLKKSLSNIALNGKNYLYSNFAYGVLGEWLAQNKGVSYEEMLNQELFKAFDMQNSYVALSSKTQREHLAKGYQSMGELVSHWHFKAIAGAGGVVSNLEDMTKYIQSMMIKSKSHDPVIKVLLESQFEIGKGNQQAIGWMIANDQQGNKYAWHNGQTAGFSGFVGFYLDGSKGLVMLNNQSIDFTQYAVSLLTNAHTLDG